MGLTLMGRREGQTRLVWKKLEEREYGRWQRRGTHAWGGYLPGRRHPNESPMKRRGEKACCLESKAELFLRV